MTTSSTPRDLALTYAQQGIFVFPTHSITADGSCSCAGKVKGCSPGKHPRTKHGQQDATTNPDVIRQWWGMWPDAGIGIDLERSGLVDVAPDCPERLTDFQQRGLPETAAYESPGGEGHVHYLYRRPEGCPTARICRSGDYDILSAGYAIAPPTAGREGSRYAWLNEPPNLNGGLPEAPAWVVAMLRNAGEKREARKPDSGEDDDGPPVRLTEQGRRRWYEGPRPDAEDRSGYLWEVACLLDDAGATERTIAAALQDRDQRHGLNKYDGRPDYYRITARNAIQRERKPSPIPIAEVESPATAPSGCEQYIALAEHLATENRTLRDENEELRAVNRGMLAILRSEATPAAKVADIELAIEAHARRPEDFTSVTGIATRLHQSDDSVSKTLAAQRAVVAVNALRAEPDPDDRPFRVAYDPRTTNPWTGEVTEQPHAYMKLAPTHARLSETLAALAAVPEELRKKGRADRGTKAAPEPTLIPDELIPGCPDDENAGSTQKPEQVQVARCEDCGMALAAMTEAGELLTVPAPFLSVVGTEPTAPHNGCGRPEYLSTENIGPGESVHERRRAWIRDRIRRSDVRLEIRRGGTA